MPATEATTEQWSEWYENPVTQEFLKLIGEMQEKYNLHLTEAAVTGAVTAGGYAGRVLGYGDVVALAYSLTQRSEYK